MGARMLCKCSKSDIINPVKQTIFAEKEGCKMARNNDRGGKIFKNLIPKIDVRNSMKKKVRHNEIHEGLSDKELVDKFMEEELKKNDAENRRRSNLKTYLAENRIPNPPLIVDISKDELFLADFVETNAISFDNMSLFDAVDSFVLENDLSKLTLKIDDTKEVIFTPNDSVRYKYLVAIKDAEDEIEIFNHGTSIRLFLEQMKDYASNGQKKTKETYVPRIITADYLNISDKETRMKVIDDIYIQLAMSQLYGKTQLLMLYNLMYCNYDVTCFLSPLFSYEQLEVLTFLYEQNESPEYIKMLRNFAEFCSNNFKYPFTNSEFMVLFDACVANQLKELVESPDFEAHFKRLYYFDTAVKMPNYEMKVDLAGSTFVMTSEESLCDGNKSIANRIYIEGVDVKGNSVRQEIYSDIDGVQSGDLSIYVNAYNRNKLLKNTEESQTIVVGVIEGKLEIVTKTGIVQEVKLKNGETIVFRMKMFCDNGENLYAPSVYLKDTAGETKQKFVDVRTSISDDGTLKPVFTKNIEELIDYFEKVEFGGK